MHINSNSIEHNRRRGDNAMTTLAFTWIARFKDDTTINQFENNTEHLFKEVLDRFSDLSYFTLYSKNGKKFTVDLNKGLIFYDNHITVEEDLIKEKKSNIRLIHFRRHRVTMSERTEQSHDIMYFLGFQYQDEQSKNHQIILQIDSDGKFIVGV